jgi:glycerol-3-phosphate dehydrogenase (NAD+)
LTEIINQDHENKKYLPGVQLPENVVAVPDIGEAVKGATALIFVMPHQCASHGSRPSDIGRDGREKGTTDRPVLNKVLSTMEGQLPKDKSVKAISLIKGVHVEGEKITLFADLISDKLGVSCSALSGANIAPEVARDRFSETTVGYRNKEEGEMWHELFGKSSLGKWFSG